MRLHLHVAQNEPNGNFSDAVSMPLIQDELIKVLLLRIDLSQSLALA